MQDTELLQTLCNKTDGNIQILNAISISPLIMDTLKYQLQERSHYLVDILNNLEDSDEPENLLMSEMENFISFLELLTLDPTIQYNIKNELIYRKEYLSKLFFPESN